MRRLLYPIPSIQYLNGDLQCDALSVFISIWRCQYLSQPSLPLLFSHWMIYTQCLVARRKESLQKRRSFGVETSHSVVQLWATSSSPHSRKRDEFPTPCNLSSRSTDAITSLIHLHWNCSSIDLLQNGREERSIDVHPVDVLRQITALHCSYYGCIPRREDDGDLVTRYGNEGKPIPPIHHIQSMNRALNGEILPRKLRIVSHSQL